jgi:hypothetical protein
MSGNAAVAINNDVLFRIGFIPLALSQPPFVSFILFNLLFLLTSNLIRLELRNYYDG